MKKLCISGVPGWLSSSVIKNYAEASSLCIRAIVQASLNLDTVKREFKSEGLSLEFRQADLLNPDSLEACCDGADTILHTAGMIHAKNIKDFYRINVDGTKNFAEKALAAGVKRFVYVSSNAAAGKACSGQGLLNETMPSNPLNDYGKSKYLAEKFLLGLRDEMEIVIIRPCMFYGPPVPLRHVDIYKRILKGRIPLVGKGDYLRSLSNIDNLVEGTKLCLEHPKAAGEIFYISDDSVYTTRQIVESMATALGVEARYLPLPAITAKVAYWVDHLLAKGGIYWQNMHLLGESDWNVGVSNKKAKRVLGYQPKVSLSQGMDAAIKWCRKELMLEQ